MKNPNLIRLESYKKYRRKLGIIEKIIKIIRIKG